jgi:hypothetical protein
VPTHEETAQFWRDWKRLSPTKQLRFREALKKFFEDLERLPKGQFRGSLRVKPMQGVDGIFEMTWEPEDGRATFEYAEELIEGEPHIIWRRIGGHDVFVSP